MLSVVPVVVSGLGVLGLGGFLEEGIVGLQIVGLDVDGVGEMELPVMTGLDGLTLSASEADLIGEGLHVACAEGATSERAPVSAAVDVGLAVGEDETLELFDLGLEVDTPAGDLLQVEASVGGEG